MDNLNKFCRACLTTKEFFTHFFFEDISPEIYMFCTTVKVEEDDQLPMGLCDQCYDLLTHFSEFKTKCLRTQDMLQLYRNGKTNILKEVEIFSDNDVKPIITNIVSVKQDQDSSKYDDYEILPSPVVCSDEEKELEKINILKSEGKSTFVQKPISSLENLDCSSQDVLQEHPEDHETAGVDCVSPVCGQKPSQLLKSYLEAHKSDRKKFTCEHCGKKFFESRHLQAHISRQHTEPQRYICSHCHYPFSNKQNLNQHMKLHDAEKKSYTCDVCERSFSVHRYLLQHIKRRHSKEKPFECSECAKTFLWKRELIDHHRVHTGEKPYKCGVCEKVFTLRNSWWKHMRLHRDSLTVPKWDS